MRTENRSVSDRARRAALPRKIQSGKHGEIVRNLLRGVGTDHSENEFVGGPAR